MIIVENRASYILFNILRSAARKGRWIIPSNCCGIIPAVFYKSGTLFETCDITHNNFCIDLQYVSDKIHQNPDEYAGVLFIYTYGVELDIQTAIIAFKEEHPSVMFIEDKCLCKPAFSENKVAISDVMLFSTGYAKYTDAGSGGYAFVSSSLSYERHELAYEPEAESNLGKKMKEAINGGERLSPATFTGNWLSGFNPIENQREYFDKIKTLTRISEQRKNEINNVYSSLLSADYCMPGEFNHWRFNIIVNEPEKLINDIVNARLFASRHYCPIDKYISTISHHSQTADWLYGHVINLFNDKYYSPDQAEMTSNLVKKHVAKFGGPHNQTRQRKRLS